MGEKEPVPPLLTAEGESNSDNPNSIKDEDGDTKDENDEIRRLEGTVDIRTTDKQTAIKSFETYKMKGNMSIYNDLKRKK